MYVYMYVKYELVSYISLDMIHTYGYVLYCTSVKSKVAAMLSDRRSTYNHISVADLDHLYVSLRIHMVLVQIHTYPCMYP